ncbi:sensor histidine kinase [Sediminibacterium sp.]|uniref:sensor histidine kinase n=1 Tax=Sediminibacterium sp. TaxID=1917865 RepID=UPI003F70460A
MKNRFEQTIIKSQLEIQTQTLNYIGSELHDDTAQIVYLSMLRIASLKDVINEKEKEEIYTLLKKVWNDLRNISHSMINHNFNQIGFLDSLENLLYNIQKTGKYSTKLNIDEEVNLDYLDKSVDVILYRMIQEVINNILKHASSNKIEINIGKQNQFLTIEVKDNGVGFDISKVKEGRSGVGLENITSRAKLINASVNIDSKIGAGTTITILIKSKQNENNGSFS